MRTTLKMVLPLIVSVAAGCLLFAAYQVHTEKRILRNDLSHRAEILGDSLQESVEPLFDRRPDGSIQRLIERFSQREHLKGVAVYDASGTLRLPLLPASHLNSNHNLRPQPVPPAMTSATANLSASIK